MFFHIRQGETSHSRRMIYGAICLGMDASEIFRLKLLEFMREKGMNAAELSRAAGLNARAVTDILERRTISPKVSTAFALAAALDVDPSLMLGLPSRAGLLDSLVQFLSQYDEAEQAQLLAALSALPRRPG